MPRGWCCAVGGGRLALGNSAGAGVWLRQAGGAASSGDARVLPPSTGRGVLGQEGLAPRGPPGAGRSPTAAPEPVYKPAHSSPLPASGTLGSISGALLQLLRQSKRQL